MEGITEKHRINDEVINKQEKRKRGRPRKIKLISETRLSCLPEGQTQTIYEDVFGGAKNSNSSAVLVEKPTIKTTEEKLAERKAKKYEYWKKWKAENKQWFKDYYEANKEYINEKATAYNRKLSEFYKMHKNDIK